MGKWTGQGFVANNESFYVTELQKIFVECFGNDFLLDPTLPQGIFITRVAELLYNADMDGVEGFARLNINNASGVYLDIIGGLRNIPRSQGTPQKVGLRLTISTNNFIQFSIPQGQAFTSLDGSYTFLNDCYFCNR